MLAPSIQPLELKSVWLTQIANDQFRYWGPLTGLTSRSSYETFLKKAAQSEALPRVLIANIRGALLVSVNLLVSEMTIRPQFTPWMGQLFVGVSQRSLGIGAALLDAAVSYVGTANLSYSPLELCLNITGTRDGLMS